MVIKLPENVKLILDLLDKSSYEAYIVGGCVRDSLMNKEPHDWDICTSAMPEQMEQVFKDFKIIPTGLKHGTLSIVIGDELYEVTTFRIDGEYEDNRHPKDVEFVSDIKLDLMRRDFTINAMAYNEKVGIVDLICGQEDINNKVIKCGGNPDERFNEDALRIMRAIRFAEKYNFSIEKETYKSMIKNKRLLTNVSMERVTDELIKTLTYGSFMRNENTRCLLICIETVTKIQLYQNYNIFDRLASSNPDLMVRLAILFDPFKDVYSFLKDMRFSNEVAEVVSDIIRVGKMLAAEIKCYLTDIDINNFRAYLQDMTFESEEKAIRYIARRILRELRFANTYEVLQYAASLFDTTRETLTLMQVMDEFEKCREEKDVYKLSDLAVNGNDIKNLGFEGSQIGVVLNFLLSAVIEDNLKNEKDELIKVAQKFPR